MRNHLSKTKDIVQLGAASEQALPVEESGSKRLRYSTVIIGGILWALLLVGLAVGMRSAQMGILEVLIVCGLLSLIPACLAMLVLLGAIKVRPLKQEGLRWRRDPSDWRRDPYEEDPSGYGKRYLQWGKFFDDERLREFMRRRVGGRDD